MFYFLFLLFVCGNINLAYCQRKVIVNGELCATRCGDPPDSSFNCQCDSECQNAGDCCRDYDSACLSCQGRACDVTDDSYPCQCTESCESLGNCCNDVTTFCPITTTTVTVTSSPSTCDTRCGQFNSNNTCQCDVDCWNRQDCCSDWEESCSNTCQGRYCYGDDSINYNCQCNSYCLKYGDCCDDISDFCPESVAGYTCKNRSCDYYDSSYPCQCNDECIQNGDCCSDVEDFCPDSVSQYTCAGKSCTSYDSSLPCQCNYECPDYGNCCPDIAQYCTCENRTCSGDDQSLPCQCNSVCSNYGDCCYDVDQYCGDGTGSSGGGFCSPVSVTNTDIKSFSLELWDNDINRAIKEIDYVIEIQASTTDSSTVDLAPDPLFSYVNPFTLEQDTYMKLQALLDNYNYMQGYEEVVTQEELSEQSDFLDSFLATDIGQMLYEFLSTNNQTGCTGIDGFKTILQDIWFGLYSRQTTDDTSGFEHVFVGEVKTNIVSGFHNWVQYYLQENQYYEANYYGYTDAVEPDIYGLHFYWHGYMKGLSGMTIGTSPEYDMAVFTLCHLLRPSAICNVNVRDDNGNVYDRSIQTWTWSNSYPPSGYPYVASAYFLA